MKVKFSTLLVGGVLLSLLSFAYAYPTKGNQMKGSTQKENPWAVSEESDKDDEIEQALAEFFSRVSEEVEAQEEAEENELAEREGFLQSFGSIRNPWR